MGDQKEANYDYLHVIETLIQTFGEVLSKDVMFTIVESCGGDLNESANAIMNIISDSNPGHPNITDENNRNILKPANTSLGNDGVCIENIPSRHDISVNHRSVIEQDDAGSCSQKTFTPLMSYAGASQSSGAVRKILNQPIHISNKSYWTDQLREILSNHNKGIRLLILLRGAPGSGKSTLAKKIVEMTIGSSFFDYKKHILSTDDYFITKGIYQFDKSKLTEAHIWNKERAHAALMHGLSPLLIDNTNIELWEMQSYVIEGVRNGYMIEVVEPNTPWARKTYQLFKKNIHNVPLTSIRKMLDKFEDNNVTGAYLIQKFKLIYPENMKPPVLRNFPPITMHTDLSSFSANTDTTSCSPSPKKTGAQEQQNIEHSDINSALPASENYRECDVINVKDNDEDITNLQQYYEIQKQLDEYAKVEDAWENGEDWGNVPEKKQEGSPKIIDIIPSANSSKPQRKMRDFKETIKTTETLLPQIKFQDWTQFLPSWENDVTTHTDKSIQIKTDKTSNSTCIEIGDTNVLNPTKMLKIISTTPRDINLYYKPLEKEAIPEERKLDKSTMTNEQIITNTFRCENEQKHFKAFRKLFRNVGKSDLRDVFDRCCGDVNWAVDIVLEGMVNKQLETVCADDISDDEEDNENQCGCVAAYNIIPDTAPMTLNITAKSQSVSETKADSSSSTPRKVKKENVLSENLIQVKRQIEQNVVISDSHYSEHCLKIRKLRRGVVNDLKNHTDLEKPDNGVKENLENAPSTSETSYDEKFLSTNMESSDCNADVSDDDDSSIGFDYHEKTVNIDLGMHFITQIDNYFGRKGMIYPDNLTTNINLPLSLVNEINALWMESVMDQLDQQSKHANLMVQQDEEFARKLAMKEAELAQAGKEPEVPDFKEIMDMDFALSLYHKDVSEWRNNEPMDLAAKLSREKLYNLFPDVSKDILSELLMAHDNNFQNTVEVLLMSTGQSAILEVKNGINKFVMEKEIGRQEKLLEEQRKALDEVEWPMLTKGKKVDMSVVNQYRQEADKHLNMRNLQYQKAQEFFRRGMTQVAAYYSEAAAFHKQKFEQANSLAAATLIQYHASNNPDNTTIDLHYLRVGEARESLDIFLDMHIQKLRESSYKNIKQMNLFFITGRGLHSNGLPKIKPAIKKRLYERGLSFSERNPGLLTAKVSAEDKLSYQIA